jgi:hypothetical protein
MFSRSLLGISSHRRGESAMKGRGKFSAFLVQKSRKKQAKIEIYS